MTSAQKVIKYMAIAFAIFLIVTIISSVLGVFWGISTFLGIKKEYETSKLESNITTFENMEIDTLDIEIAYANLVIKTGDVFKIETNNKNIECKQINQKLQIKEKNHPWFYKAAERDLIVYIPEGIEFEKVKINGGAGKIEIEELKVDNLAFKIGAGATKIQTLEVFQKAKIEGGAGKISILEGRIHDLDLEVGIGQAELHAELLGKNEINAGIGKLDVYLKETEEEYKIQVDKGIGSIRIDGREMADNETYGNGENTVKIEGGIGSIIVELEQEM